MIIVVACVIAITVIAFILVVRPKDLPQPEAESPFAHLDDRKAAIYENLRDLQFEYRVGKLSDEDYQNTKRDLQKELAKVLAEVDRLKNGVRQASRLPKATQLPAEPNPLICPTCGAKFNLPLKFCGECGKPMKVAR
jgi:hypothetical protein